MAISPSPPYTPDPPYRPYGYDRSNGCSFLTSIHLRPCTVSDNCLISECLCDFRVGLLGTPEKRARGPISPKLDPKSRKHSEIRNISDTVQGLRLVLVRNDQPFDHPCPYGECRGSGVCGGYGGLTENGCLSPIFRAFYLN